MPAAAGGWVIGFDERKATRVVEQFLIARRAMYDTVYYHKTVRCAEGMLALFLRRLRWLVQEQGVELPAGLDLLRPMIRVIQGQALEQPDLLRLDDFALFVLVETIAQSGLRDETARDLARRISSRDLFKIVHVSTKRLNRYFRSARAVERLFDAIRPFCPGDPEYYLVIDETEFEMMSSVADQKVALLDEHGVASFARDHPAFEALARIQTENLRLFTVREAVSAVEAEISRVAPAS
jgi:HD superfamily phosphohydrolase